MTTKNSSSSGVKSIRVLQWAALKKQPEPCHKIVYGSRILEEEAVKLKLSWVHKDVSDIRAIAYPWRKAANREWNQPKRTKFVAAECQICQQQSTKVKGVGDLKSALTLDMEMWRLEIVQLDFGFALIQYFLWCFRMVMYIPWCWKCVMCFFILVL